MTTSNVAGETGSNGPDGPAGPAEDGDDQACGSCDRAGEVTVTYPDTVFVLCLRCVPGELLELATPLEGADDAEAWLSVLLAEQAAGASHVSTGT